MSNTHNAEIILTATAGPGTFVKVNGVELGSVTQSLGIYAGVGSPTRLTLDLLLHETRVNGQVEVEVPPSTRNALIALGWVPPEQARALLRGDEQP